MRPSEAAMEMPSTPSEHRQGYCGSVPSYRRSERLAPDEDSMQTTALRRLSICSYQTFKDPVAELQNKTRTSHRGDARSIENIPTLTAESRITHESNKRLGD